MSSSDEPGFEGLSYEQDGAIAWVTLDRPERHNSVDPAMAATFRELWQRLRHDDSVRVVVVTGAGEKAFCSGIDRAHDIPQPSSPFAIDDPMLALCPKSADLWKPVIAAVNGLACGGAFYLLGEVEFIIAAEHATFFDPHVTYGMTAAFEPMHLLSRMPLGEVMRLSLLGNHERMTARRAHEVGLVSEVVPAEELRSAARWAAEAIATAPPEAVEGTVRSIWAAQQLGPRQGLAMAPAFVQLGNTPSALAEGQRAFASGQRLPWRAR